MRSAESHRYYRWLLLFIAILSGCRTAPKPEIVLWVWERPTDLRALPPGHALAILLFSVDVQDGETVFRPRMQPLRPPPKPRVIGVVRIEADESLRAVDVLDIQRPIVDLVQRHNLTAVQIDFDATESQRGFYRRLLEGLRSALPRRMPLSITALASWCTDDPWIRGLPVDEAVPMLFQMGPDSQHVRSRVESGAGFRVDLCRSSVGISLAEPFWNLPRVERVFVFSDRGWTPEAFAVVQNLRRRL